MIPSSHIAVVVPGSLLVSSMAYPDKDHCHALPWPLQPVLATWKVGPVAAANITYIEQKKKIWSITDRTSIDIYYVILCWYITWFNVLI